MSPRCTGECCSHIYLSVSQERLRQLKDVELDVQAALVWSLMKPLSLVEPEISGVVTVKRRCLALTAVGCSLPREERPWCCNMYPLSIMCSLCGSRSDQEARGVAMVVVSSP